MVCVGPDAFPQACIANIFLRFAPALSCSIASWQLAVAKVIAWNYLRPDRPQVLLGVHL